jgi:hypothetical protein
MTHVGDFALTARNGRVVTDTRQLGRIRSRFARLPAGPEPIVPGNFA